MYKPFCCCYFVFSSRPGDQQAKRDWEPTTNADFKIYYKAVTMELYETEIKQKVQWNNSPAYLKKLVLCFKECKKNKQIITFLGHIMSYILSLCELEKNQKKRTNVTCPKEKFEECKENAKKCMVSKDTLPFWRPQFYWIVFFDIQNLLLSWHHIYWIVLWFPVPLDAYVDSCFLS